MERKRTQKLNQKQTSRMVHGGDVYRNEVALDFSISTNPCADLLLKAAFKGSVEDLKRVPFLLKYADAFQKVYEAALRGLQMSVQYPDLTCTLLRKEIARLEQVDPECIICGNGASELFMAIVRAINPDKALVLAPCYSGYEYALRSAGCEVISYRLKEENDFKPQEDLLDMLTDDLGIFFLAVPNNPTGCLVDNVLLKRIVQVCEDKKILLVTDACFYPLADDASLPYGEHGVVVKAFTKTMAIPGLRLGYLITRDMELKQQIEGQLSEWSVSSVAQQTGCATARLFAETDFLEVSRQYIKEERCKLAQRLEAAGLRVFNSDTDYLLIKGRAGLWEQLLEKKILVRNCDNFVGLGPEYIRIAVKMHWDNQNLADQIDLILR